jgi:hypothetical protein
MSGRATALTATAMVLLPCAAPAVTLDSLQGATIETSALYNTRIRLDGKEFDAQTRWSMRMTVSAGGAFNLSFSRVGMYQGRDMGSINRSTSGTIGTPQQLKSGHSLWLLIGDKMIMLRTFEVGGVKAEVTFSPDGRSCSLRAPIVREAGAGATRTDSAARPGSKVEVLSAAQVSTNCKVSR